MGSMRNPVGPLPSTIYWRRRAVLLSLLALLALLIVWVVASGGGDGTKNENGASGKNPASTITPGPSGSGPAISENPGGREESTAGTGDSGSDDGSGSTSGTTSGSTSGSGDSAGTSGTGSDDGSNGDGESADQLPAGSTLPNCAASSLKLTLHSLRNTYTPGEKPTLELTATNSSGSDCKVDLGPKSAVLTITQAESDEDIWSSGDCPTGSGSLLFRVPANGQVTHTVVWDRKASAPECATPPAISASAGTYLVEAVAPGLTKTQTSFVLSKD